MSAPLDRLREMYPWPTMQSAFPGEPEGLLDRETKDAIEQHLPADAACVIELGSYEGGSAEYLLSLIPGVVICVDHWQGFPGWNLRQRMLPHYQRFVATVWEHRDRVIPVREKTVAGLARIHDCGIRPDLILIDAGHDEQSVYEDVSVSCELFPGVNLIGHDWSNRPGVAAGLRRAVAEGLTSELPTFTHGENWWSLTTGAQP